jgi:pyridoxamine 5'-phosphate oxidase
MSKTRDPIQLFLEWIEEAKKTNLPEPTAVVLATVSPNGQPSARVVLLKDVDAQGFVFYTNLESQKARDLKMQPVAALCFYWPPLAKQVRVEGPVESVSDVEADAYFATRPRGAQIGAWASQQSAPLESRAELEARVKQFEEKFSGREAPRPEFWSGFRVIPQRIEFWQSRENRLHDRLVYERQGDGWTMQMLYP